MRPAFRFVPFLLLGLAACPLQAAVSYIDLSKAADMGPTQSFEGEAPAGEDLREKEGVANIPQGPQTLRGIPFMLLDSIKNQGHSFVVLKGRHKGSFPEAVAIPTEGLKAGYLYFLHSCKWGGTASNITVAEYDIVYEDGQVAVIPLRVGVELTNFTGSDDTSASTLAWWHKYKNTDMGINFFPWKNPRPDAPIQTILFKSLNKMPVPILFAITASGEELVVSKTSPKPEKTFQTDTTGWLPFDSSMASPTGTAIDMSPFLDAPAGKHGTVKSEGGRIVFEDGTEARFWGISLEPGWANMTDDELAKTASRLAAYGCNLVAVDASSGAAVTGRLGALVQILKAKGIYLDLTEWDKTQVPPSLSSDPAVLNPSPWTFGKAYRNGHSDSPHSPEFSDDPMVLKPEASIPCQLSFSRSLGLPYRVEWRAGWPNEYSAEAPLLMAAYGGFGNWSACVGMGLGGEDWGTALSADTDLSNEPLLLAQWPAAALAYLRGDLKAGRLYVLEARDQKPDLGTCLNALAHQSGLDGEGGKFKTDPAGILKAKVLAKTKSIVSDTSQIHWQGNIGLVQVSSPRFQAVIGFVGHQQLKSPVWQVESGNLFASLSLISLTKTSLWTSDHMLLTGVARMENTGQVYNAAKTRLISTGQAPILMEPLNAKITLFRYKTDPKLKVRALDINGQVLPKKVPVKWEKSNMAVTWIPNAFYLEFYK